MNRKYRYGLLLMIVVLGVVSFATPGSQEDPLITLKYLQGELDDIKREILGEVDDLVEQKLDGSAIQAEPTTPLTEPNVAQREVFEALTFPAGTQLVFGQSTEFIVRTGSATLVDPVGSHLPDLTRGVDIIADQQIPLNHHMICPREDGRGLLVKSGADFWIMIKGPYQIVQ